jgi:error-prone DNA polymerase
VARWQEQGPGQKRTCRSTPRRRRPPITYVELHCRSAFSLLAGASLPEALVARALAVGLPGLALTDRHDLGGIVRFAEAARAAGIDGIIGAEVDVVWDDEDPACATPLVVLAESRAGYANVSTLITRARMDQPRGQPSVRFAQLAAHAHGVHVLTGGPRGRVPAAVADGRTDDARAALGRLRDAFDGRVAVECWDHGLPEERVLVAELIPLARQVGVPWVVTNDARYADPGARVAHDVLCALRHGRPLDAMGTRLPPNGEWYLKGPAAVARRWRHAPGGLRASVEIAERCTFRVAQLEPTLPAFPLPPGIDADAYLAELVETGAQERWGDARTEAHARQLAHELAVIRRMGLAGYFLIVWDIVRFARREGILCQGRGSAANSAVCYCLAITAVDPVAMDLLFERFLSEERQEAPDIDLDFAHRERERVIQYVYRQYGRAHAAMVCEQITWRGRSAVRDAARALGFSPAQADALSAFSDRFSARATADALRVDAPAPAADGASPTADAHAATDANAMAAQASWTHPPPSGQWAHAHAQRDAAKRALRAEADAQAAAQRRAPEPADPIVRALASGLVRGTEATTRARAVKAESQRVAEQPRTYASFEPFGSPSAREAHGPPRRASVVASQAGAPDWQDPHAAPTPEERRNPTTAVRPAAPAPEDTVLARAGLDPGDPRVRVLADVVDGLHQLPRHRSIHVGGFVLTAEPLSTVVPIEPASMPGRTVIQWEKDDLDPVRLVKIDLLGLGMLTVLQDCLKYLRTTRGLALDLAALDLKDADVYEMLCRADTVGVFQVESRAQMNTLPRLQPRCFYDLVVEVSLIRPGPIQGDMVHPYLRRRAGLEAVTYPHPSLEPALRRTLGVPLFQEQGMQVAIAAAGFSPGEADALRRAMGHKRSHEKMAEICERLVAGMARNGIPEDTARRIYNQINAFADYGFPESHAASFALIVYASAYLKWYYAPEFLCALLNAQPMGFYAPGTLIEDARRHGVRVLPVDVTRSAFDSTLVWGAGGAGCGLRTAEENGSAVRSPQPGPAVRLGLRLVRGLGARAKARLEMAARGGPFRSVDDLVARTGLDRRALRVLAEAGALDAFVPDEPQLRRRRAAVWRLLEAERGDAGPLAPRVRTLDIPAAVPAMTPYELTEADYRVTGVSLVGHPMTHLRDLLTPNGVRPARTAVQDGRDGELVAVAGLVICRQRPGTAKGFVFLTLEDETGTINIVVNPKRFERDALLISTSPLLLVRGRLQVEGAHPHAVVNVRAERVRRLDAPLGAEHARGHDFR